MVHVYPKIILLWTTVLSVLLSHGQETETLDRLFAQSPLLQKHYYGFSLYDLDSNKYVYGYHADQHFTPASNTKVYTLYTALQNIGDSIPGLQYVERGDSLIFWGTGDPTFLHPKLDNGRVYNFLKNSEKQLYYQPQHNPDGPHRNGWAIEDYNYYYQTDIVPFPIYGNLVRFAAEEGVLKAYPTYFEQTIADHQKSKKVFSIQRQIGANVFEWRGNGIPKKYTTYKPFVWSDTLFTRLLADTLHVPVNILEDNRKYNDVRTLYSSSRNTVLREMMLPSDNFLAEQLTMVAAHIKYGHFLTDSLRQEMNTMFFSEFGDTIRLYDGSGLSVYNKITPNNMMSLLLALNEHIGNDYQLRMFFAAGGVEGTLKNMYRMDNAGPFVWAKTGTLNSVYCQSGYLVTQNGRRLAFSFLNNNFSQPLTTIRREVARLITYIHESY